MSQFADTENRNLLTYTQQLFSAAIQSSVARSEATLGKQNVFAIETEIGTFEFEKALNDGLNVHYDKIAAQFANWLENWLKPFGAMIDVVPKTGRRLVRPALSNTPIPRAILSELEDRLKDQPCIRATSNILCEWAMLNEKGEHSGKYKSRSLVTCFISRPTNLLQFSFQTGPNGSFASANLGCSAVNNKGGTLRFTPDVQELTRSGEPLRSFRVFFLFDQTLRPDSPDQPYLLEYQYDGDDPYPNFGRRGEASTLFSGQGAADEAILALAFPRSKLRQAPNVSDVTSFETEQLNAIDLRLEGNERLVPSEELSVLAVAGLMELDHATDNYRLVGRRARNLQQNEGFGFVID